MTQLCPLENLSLFGDNAPLQELYLLFRKARKIRSQTKSLGVLSMCPRWQLLEPATPHQLLLLVQDSHGFGETRGNLALERYGSTVEM